MRRRTNLLRERGGSGSRVFTTCAVACMAATFAMDASAEFNVIRNGVNWDATYEAVFEPHSGSTDPIWIEGIGGAQSSRVAAGGILTLTSVDISNLRYDQTGASWTGLGAQRSIEWRMRVVSQSAPDRATDVLSFAAGDGFWIVEFKDSSLRLNGSSMGSDILLDTTIFRTYRLVIDSTQSVDRAVLYVDGTEFITSGAATPGDAGAGDLLAFGDGSTGGIGAVIEWDFISWTAGAFPASPFGISFNTIVVADTAAMEFASTLGVDYNLEFTTDIIPPTNWVVTGATVTGNGGTMQLFDPTGFSTQKMYRILAPPM